MGGPLTEGGHDDPRADTTPRDDHGRRLKGFEAAGVHGPGAAWGRCGLLSVSAGSS